MDLTFNQTQVGKRMNFQPVLYVTYFYRMCKTNVNDVVKPTTNPHTALANFCYYLRDLLHSEFVTDLKDHNACKLIQN